MIDIRPDSEDVLIAVKAVPGASRTRIIGALGDRLKITVAAAPEQGKANMAICALLAERCGLPARDVTVECGTTTPLKTVRLRSISIAEVRSALGI